MDVSHVNTALLKLPQKVLHVGKLTAANNPAPSLAAALCHGNNVVHRIRFSRTQAAYGSFYIWLEKAKNSTPNRIPFLYCHLLFTVPVHWHFYMQSRIWDRSPGN